MFWKYESDLLFFYCLVSSLNVMVIASLLFISFHSHPPLMYPLREVFCYLFYFVFLSFLWHFLMFCILTAWFFIPSCGVFKNFLPRTWNFSRDFRHIPHSRFSLASLHSFFQTLQTQHFFFKFLQVTFLFHSFLYHTFIFRPFYHLQTSHFLSYLISVHHKPPSHLLSGLAPFLSAQHHSSITTPSPFSLPTTRVPVFSMPLTVLSVVCPCSIKPTLKKVSKYENKFAKLQKKAAEFNFRNQLKTVKKKEFELEDDKEKVSVTNVGPIAIVSLPPKG